MYITKAHNIFVPCIHIANVVVARVWEYNILPFRCTKQFLNADVLFIRNSVPSSVL